MHGKDVFLFCTLCWFWLDFRSELSLYICRYILHVYALLWLVLERKIARRADVLFSSFARALSLAQNRRYLSLLVSV